MSPFVIAVDGPAGTGKSTVARRLAHVLDFTYVDTGALYRAVALLYLREGATTDAAIQVARTVRFRFCENRLFAGEEDVTDSIRTPEVSLASSLVGSISEVRFALLDFQRRLGSTGRVILEGRDIGTVVFPKADLKFFLSAGIDERTRRRFSELYPGLSLLESSFNELKAQMILRDQADSSRSVAPLIKADDALEIDTTFLSLDEVVKRMEMIARQRLML